ncbi:tRNA (adenosine(37)-N6)-threonylcarbamoyltransferase complex transferase subunit TsaD [Enterococcus sp. BWB1-3]|uniref:tRNA (adenosine(37)-N6)-threonylcarbamoyltransferase complex transferase subunit TsaD n=1 Tax=unclassified Enterococcus TaxID=2608891 RepID=UPI0019213EE2|nr:MULTISPECIES: tRNA (adenosine(37)-N6)-threonylcarbamoyltransferase complex transferase subunit TsaD [unclassified Enterococcus]MBL1230482.1 tRNA (adenosine(37)-N6)-threonylcarbamoyltransferase complex transferase subunit TsaD [Enterococcus sp. BWB1-3]MCB5950862.1 tRNA (adenosine(37)-N6)-threonylcarbamoyltransferase complex transferase subunit TsaD [Enterococcus sp. BWT-B8]MCB5955303.1 tRNA (adenosine(37)-N6)-threonylcarbamoyltransferase complex transferase subunit TsaD [Enterococcus sp. CWB-B
MTVSEKENNLLLAIESSCDETSVSVIKNGGEILSNVIASQIKSHQRFGGVVPEVASRHHVEQITICIDEALTEAAVSPDELSAVAVTYGPGLVGALLIGVSAAKAFAWAHDLPLVPVNHMAGHIYAAKLVQPLEFPLMALLVSGGHTELVYMKEDGEYEIIGETRDDAAGEAYDKVGRVLGLAYPSGREIDILAHQGSDTFHFPRAMMKESNYDFSFSGLKSAFINTVHNAEQREEVLNKEDLAASFQASVIEVLVSKTIRACQEYQVKQLIVAGGVAANQGLRTVLEQETADQLPNVQLIIPPLKLCGDNAAMIGAAAFIEQKKGKFADYHLNAVPGLSF